MVSRNEHGAYGPTYEAATDAPVAGGGSSQPPHTGVERPMASAPHAWHDGARTVRRMPSFPAMLTLFAVLLGALAMFWPTHRLRLNPGSGADEVVQSFWIHGASAIEPDMSGPTLIRPIGLVLFILLMLGAIGSAIAASCGRSVRSDALGLLGVAVFAGAILAPSLMVFGEDVDNSGYGTQFEYAAGIWLGTASGVCALVAAVLFFCRLGRYTLPRVRD